MTRLSPQERQMQEMNRLGRLGSPTGVTVALVVPPFRYFLGGWLVILLGIASIAGAVLMAILGNEPVGGAFFCGLGMFFVIGGFFMHRQREVSRGALELHERGFVHAQGKRRRVVVHEEIGSLSLVESEELSNGTRAGWRRQLTIEDGSGKATLRQLTLLGQPDGFGDFLNALLEESATAATARMKAGTPLKGAGWALDSGGLAYAGAPEGRPLAYTEIAAADLFEGKIALWRRGEESPCFAVKAGSPNARLLWTIIRRNLPAAGAERTDPDSLGRLLFQKKGTRAALLTSALLGLSFAACGVFMFTDGKREDLLWGACGMLLGLFILGAAVHMATYYFKVHEKGLVRRTLLGTRRLRNGEIARFSYSATRMYHNGVYTGTQVMMSFAPADGKALRLNAGQRGSDADLDLLRDRVAEMISARLYDLVKARAEVAWGKSASLSLEGVRYRTKKLFGGETPGFAAFSDGLREAFADGSFRLYAGGSDKPVHQIPCGDENFYPGYLLFGRLATEAAAPAPPRN